MFSRRLAVVARARSHAFLIPTTSSQCPHELGIRLLPQYLVRTYATPSRPRSVVGEPSRPVRRAVKRTAAKATDTSESPAKRQNEKRQKDAAKKAKAAKPKSKQRQKKELTEEQKAVKQARADKLEIKDLKKAALKPPMAKTSTAYVTFITEKFKEGPGVAPGQAGTEYAQKTMKANAAAWKECSAADIEHYNHLANERSKAAQAEYKRWVESHTIEEIAIANRARLLLRRKLPQQKRNWPKIKDERAAKRPVPAFVQFSINRLASGDFKHIRPADRLKLLGKEWHALSSEEKDKYKQLQHDDLKRYKTEYQSVHGHLPPSTNGSYTHEEQELQAAAAAA